MLVKQMEQRFDNLEGRVDRIEQILPTLATKGDLQAAVEPLATKAELRAAIDAAVEPLATKAEPRVAIDAAVEPLATKAELRAAIDAAVEPLATKAELRGRAAGDEGGRPSMPRLSRWRRRWNSGICGRKSWRASRSRSSAFEPTSTWSPRACGTTSS